MKKTTFTLLLALFCCRLAAQCPVGSITFTSQSQIDSFHILYPSCQDLPDNLTINGAGIFNLNGLLGITSVGGDLSISFNDSLPNLHGLDSLHSIGESLLIANNSTLGSLAGLDNLSSIGEDLKISSNAVLTDISSLKNLAAIPGSLTIGSFNSIFGGLYLGNPSLPNLTGLENIQSAEKLQIFANASLTNLAGLSGLIAVSDIEIIRNSSLTDLTGLSGISSASSITIIANPLTSLAGLHQITSVPGLLRIGNCPLPDLSELGNINSAGSIYLYGLDSISSLAGLENIDSIPGTLSIGSFNYFASGQPIPVGNNGLTDLTGLENIVHTGSLRIIGNASLPSLNGLNQLSSITDDIVISGNPVLNDLSSLSFVTSLSGSLYIEENPVLPDLSAFENLTFVAGPLSIYRNDSLQTLCGLNKDLIIEGGITVANNPSLSTCHVESICNFLTNPPIHATILNNAPGCESLSVVQAACALSPAVCASATEIFFPDKIDGLMAFPNPAGDFLQIELPKSAGFSAEVQVFDTPGRFLLHDQLAIEQPFDVRRLPPGAYILKVFAGERVYAGRFVKL